MSSNVNKSLGNIIYLTKNDKIFPMIPTGINPPKYDLFIACPVRYIQFGNNKIELYKDYQEILIEPRSGVDSQDVRRFKFTVSLRKFNSNSNSANTAYTHCGYGIFSD